MSASIILSGATGCGSRARRETATLLSDLHTRPLRAVPTPVAHNKPECTISRATSRRPQMHVGMTVQYPVSTVHSAVMDVVLSPAPRLPPLPSLRGPPSG